jgi:MoaA/NifB/PqqE/SkfB family radical SAM enzyme
LSKKTGLQALNKLSLLHWHIEPSSICTLKCPRCPRAEVPESLLNKQLTLDFFKDQIGKDVVRQMKKITFCGNDGDHIYCNDLIPIIKWIKQVNTDICIVLITNGSHKKVSWWEELATVLDNKDEIHWSLDGWEQLSNEKYRINSDWDSIVNGITEFNRVNTSTYKVWAAIAFKFNEDYLHEMEHIANTMYFDAFQLTLSTKFGSKYPKAYSANDDLEPTGNFIPDGHRFQRNNTLLSAKTRYSETVKKYYKEKIAELSDPKLCLIGNKGVFLNSHGEFYPCCWTANRYAHNKEWIDLAQTKFNLHNTTFTKILNNKFWSTKFLKFDSLECTTKCNKECLKGEYLTDW